MQGYLLELLFPTGCAGLVKSIGDLPTPNLPLDRPSASSPAGRCSADPRVLRCRARTDRRAASRQGRGGAE